MQIPKSLLGILLILSPLAGHSQITIYQQPEYPYGGLLSSSDYPELSYDNFTLHDHCGSMPAHTNQPFGAARPLSTTNHPYPIASNVQLRHAGPKDVTREAERPSNFAWSD